jgi:hypothetical protein
MCFDDGNIKSESSMAKKVKLYSNLALDGSDPDEDGLGPLGAGRVGFRVSATAYTTNLGPGTGFAGIRLTDSMRTAASQSSQVSSSPTWQANGRSRNCTGGRQAARCHRDVICCRLSQSRNISAFARFFRSAGLVTRSFWPFLGRFTWISYPSLHPLTTHSPPSISAWAVRNTAHAPSSSVSLQAASQPIAPRVHRTRPTIPCRSTRHKSGSLPSGCFLCLHVFRTRNPSFEKHIPQPCRHQARGMTRKPRQNSWRRGSTRQARQRRPAPPMPQAATTGTITPPPSTADGRRACSRRRRCSAHDAPRPGRPPLAPSLHAATPMAAGPARP